MSQNLDLKWIFRYFKTKGLNLSTGATKALFSVLIREEDFESIINSIYEKIKSKIAKREINSSIIDVDVLAPIIEECTMSEEDLNDSKLELYSAFKTPKLIYNDRQKAYKIIPIEKYSVFGDVVSRANMYRERLQYTLHRLLRSGSYYMKGVEYGSHKTKDKLNPSIVELSSINSLLGSVEYKNIFGMITQPEMGRFYLEDLTGVVPLSFKALKMSRSDLQFITEGSQVIVGGYFDDGCFIVEKLISPLLESQGNTLHWLNIVDRFAGGYTQEILRQMKQLEQSSHDSLFIFISDIDLRRSVVCERLSKVFQGYEAAGLDPVFVLMGSFSSSASSEVADQEQILQDMESLAQCVESCTRLRQQSKFLLLPGPLDVGRRSYLPKKELSELFQTPLKKMLAQVYFGSNPCRMRYFTQEIVMFREDLYRHWIRSSLLTQQPHQFTSIDQDERNHRTTEDSLRSVKGEEDPLRVDTLKFLENVANQGHLWPFPARAKPIIWDLDAAFRLHPLPDLVVIGDQLEASFVSIEGSLFACPGSFTQEFTFLAYYPDTKTIEKCDIK